MMDYEIWDIKRRSIWPKADHGQYITWDKHVMVAKYTEEDPWIADNLRAVYEEARLAQ